MTAWVVSSIVLALAIVVLWAAQNGILTIAISVLVQKGAIAVIRFWCWRERRRAERRIRREMVSYYRRTFGRRPTRAELRAEGEHIRRSIWPPELK